MIRLNRTKCEVCVAVLKAQSSIFPVATFRSSGEPNLYVVYCLLIADSLPTFSPTTVVKHEASAQIVRDFAGSERTSQGCHKQQENMFNCVAREHVASSQTPCCLLRGWASCVQQNKCGSSATHTIGLSNVYTHA